MKTDQTISRNLESANPYGFDRLRKEGIEISQDLSGMGWTDYNYHDPGVTILEQVCFGLTDLIYRTKFDVADYLCNEGGEIDTATLGLHSPQDVFFSRPSTTIDYQKALLDMSRDINDIHLFSNTAGSQGGGYGLYQVRVRKSPEKSGMSIDAALLMEQTSSNFHSIRNLCEDLGEIKVIEELDCYLEAEISIKPGYRVANVLAEVFYVASTELTKGIDYQPFSERLSKGDPLDETFRGPFTKNGLVDDLQVVHTDEFKDKQLLESAILSASRGIAGVEYVASLRLRANEQGAEKGNIPDTCKYRLIEPSDPVDFKGLLVKSSGHQANFAFDEFKAQFETLKFASSSKSYKLEDDQVLSNPPKGNYRNLASYQSVQNQFPQTYGINQFGVPDSYSAERKAQALQLKSYLLLFEQIMSNYLANLGSIRQIFSVKSDGESTYYSGVLNNKEISSLDKVYPTNAETILDNILGKIDNFVNRKSRLLDYLLALYGEEFSQDQLRNFNYYYSSEELERFIIVNKIRLLNRIKFASGDRGAAANIATSRSIFLDTPEHITAVTKRLENVSGIQYRVSIFLGFRYLTPRSLVREIFRHDLTLLPHDKYLQKDSSKLDFYSSRENKYVRLAGELSRKTGEQSERDKRSYRLYRDKYTEIQPLSNGLLSESILRGGVRDANYFYDEESDALTLELDEQGDAKNGSGVRETLITGIGSERTAEQRRILRCFLSHINNECEGMHVLEHILLRPSDFLSQGHELKNKYANRISVILPAWTARCNNPQFRSFAENLIRDNCPAHIRPEIYWLSFSGMCEYEVLQDRWSELLQSKPQSDEFDVASRSLMRFLELQRTKEGLFGSNTGGLVQLKEELITSLSRYIGRLEARREELNLCVRRITDEEQTYLRNIELLKAGLNKFRVRTVEHMRLTPLDYELDEADWDFHISSVSVILPKLRALEITSEQNSHFDEVKVIVEKSIRSSIDSALAVHFHWLVPADMDIFQTQYTNWHRLRYDAEVESGEGLAIASTLRSTLKKLIAATESTGDIHNWTSVLGEQ